MHNTQKIKLNCIQLFLISALLLWVTALYYQGLTGPFTLDDLLIFPSTQLVDPNYHNVMRTLSLQESGIFGRPIPVLSFIFNHQYLGAAPFGYKSVNLALHLINTLLVFTFTFAIIKTLKKTPETSLVNPFSLALITATIWAIHPIQVSTVLYVYQRMTLFSTFFTLCALICYFEARTKMYKPKYCVFLLFFLFPIMQVCAIASKENGALIPLYITLIEVIIFRCVFTNYFEKNIIKIFFGCFVALPIALAFYYFSTHIPQIMEGYNGRDFTLPDRIRSETVALVFYLKLMLLPNISEMSLFHDGFPIYREISQKVFWSALLLLAIGCIAFLSHRKLKVVSIAIGFFLVAHLLESTFIPLELVFEHRNYFALFGFCLIFAWIIGSLYYMYEKKLIAYSLVGFLILSFSAMTFSRSMEWSNELSINSIATEKQPNSLRAKTSLMSTYTNLQRYEEAHGVLASAITQFPKQASLQVLQITLNCLTNHHNREDIDKARKQLESRALRQDVPPTFTVLLDVKQKGFCENLTYDTINQLLTVAIRNPVKKMPQISKSILWQNHYMLNTLLGHHDSAHASLEQASFESPNHPELTAALAYSQIERGELQDAIINIDRITKINRKYGNAYKETIGVLQSALSKHHSKQQYSDNAPIE